MAIGPGTSELIPTMTAPPRVAARTSTVQAQFNARAKRFGAHDAVVREVGSRLIERMQYIRLDPNRILDVGCGAGSAMQALRSRHRAALVVGADLSLGMLRQSPTQPWARLPRWLSRPAPLLINADAARLPLAADSFDLVFSNLMLHWHPQPHAVFPEWKRVLRVDGLLLFSCFGPDTLKELRAACRIALPRARPMPFIDMHDFGDMMVASGFANPVMDAEVLTLTYPDPRRLLREAGALGGNPRDDRFPALPSGRQARNLLDALQARQRDGVIQLTFEVAYGHAWKPVPRTTGSTTVSVDTLRAELARRRPASSGTTD